jgi:ATP-dependent Clp protease ATP-binding subunit ClpA
MLEIDDEVRDYLAAKGYDRLMGARPMQRLIQDEIKKPLASMILFGDLVDGGTVHVTLTTKEDASEEASPAIELDKTSANEDSKAWDKSAVKNREILLTVVETHGSRNGDYSESLHS